MLFMRSSQSRPHSEPYDTDDGQPGDPCKLCAFENRFLIEDNYRTALLQQGPVTEAASLDE